MLPSAWLYYKGWAIYKRGAPFLIPEAVDAPWYALKNDAQLGAASKPALLVLIDKQECK